MWCPKCKIEYQKGITVCADCGSELVERDGEYGIDICEVKDAKAADEIMKYLAYSGIEGAEKETLEDSEGFKILVPEKQEKKAEKLIKGYLLGKQEEKEALEAAKAKEENASEEALDAGEDNLEDMEAETVQTDNVESEEGLFSKDVESTGELLHASGKGAYVKMADKYRDMKFSGITFIIFGIVGIAYLVLTKLEIIPIQYSTFVFYVIAALFAGFLIAGIVSCIKSKKFKALISVEEEKTAAIKEWMIENLSKEVVSKWYDSNVSTGENDLLIAAHIRTALSEEYPNEPIGYLELLADEYYEENFYEAFAEEE